MNRLVSHELLVPRAGSCIINKILLTNNTQMFSININVDFYHDRNMLIHIYVPIYFHDTT